MCLGDSVMVGFMKAEKIPEINKQGEGKKKSGNGNGTDMSSRLVRVSIIAFHALITSYLSLSYIPEFFFSLRDISVLNGSV